MKSLSYAEITPKTRKWLWPGRLPLRQMVLVVGQGGIGKGLLIADLGSRITHGQGMPDGSPCPKGKVLLISGEDDPEFDIWWRLQAAGADMELVRQYPREGFSIPESLEELADEVNEIGGVVLVVIDPLSSFSSIALTSTSKKLRAIVTEPLEDFARATGVTLAVIHHTVKNGDVAGAKTLTDAARMVLMITKDESRKIVRRIKVFKTNIASDAQPEICYAVLGRFPDVKVRYFTLSAPPDAPESLPEPPKPPPLSPPRPRRRRRSGRFSVAGFLVAIAITYLLWQIPAIGHP